LQSSRRRVQELLWIFGLNRLTAWIWEVLRGRKAISQYRRMKDFYSALLPKDALIFDIGANIGTMTRVFVSLGAQVVAIEPNPDCVRHIELTTSRKAVEVLHAAVSDANGLAVLQVSDRKDKMSSLSDDWRDAVSRQNADYVGIWNRELTVPSVTLDALIERYGLPYYIKIDVEGHEERVIQGLSHRPPLLSFEFNRVFLDSALRAIANGVFAESLFNYTLVDPCKFELPDWVGRDELRERIRKLDNDGPALGDIFVKTGARPWDI
jgi:FkbM family methyltransferase